MASSGSLTSGVAGRYATALLEIARENGSLEKVEADLAAFEDALRESGDLRAMIGSPVVSRSEQAAAMAALAERMGLGLEVRNTLGLMAENRRLFVLPALLVTMKRLLAEERGEITAEVATAKPLSDEQRRALAEKLQASVGRAVKLDVTVDEDLIGGLVIRVGSRMIDSSIRSKLANLQNVMKEVG